MMELDPIKEWEEYSPPVETNNLNKGMGLGKKIVISGVVISATPIIIPTLVMVSAVGLALSVPFGFFFTTYVCTQKLINKLFSTPLHNYEDKTSDDACEFDDTMEEVDRKDQEKGYEKDGRMAEPNVTPLLEETEDQKQKEDDHKDDHKPIENTPEAQSVPKEDEKNGSNFEEKAIDIKEGDKLARVTTEDDKHVQVKDTHVAADKNDKKHVGSAKTMDKSSGNKKKKQGHKTAGAAHEGNNGSSGKVVKPVGDRHTVEETRGTTNVRSTESPSPKSSTVSSDKTKYSEDEAWEKMRALRSLVGYSVSEKATCVEELKALYVFTGVEPPFPFRGPYDLAEINDKLRFLMSAVGVK